MDELHYSHDVPLFKAAQVKHEPDFRASLRHVWRSAKSRASVKALEARITSSDWPALARAWADTKLADGLRSVLRPRVEAAYLDGVQLGARPLHRLGVQTRAPKPPLSIHLTDLNPYAAAYAAARSGDLLNEPKDTQDFVKDIVLTALQQGLSPAEVAEVLRDGIGLDARRAGALGKFASAQQAAGVNGAALQDAIDGYADELLDARAMTISRTEILMATNAGQAELWNVAQQAGVLDDSMQKIWIVTDGCCDLCDALGAADPIALDDSFDAGVEYPPLHPNCRCTMGLVAAPEKMVALAQQRELAASRAVIEQAAVAIASMSEAIALLTKTMAAQALAQAEADARRNDPARVDVEVVRDTQGRVTGMRKIAVRS